MRVMSLIMSTLCHFCRPFRDLKKQQMKEFEPVNFNVYYILTTTHALYPEVDCRGLPDSQLA